MDRKHSSTYSRQCQPVKIEYSLGKKTQRKQKPDNEGKNERIELRHTFQKYMEIMKLKSPITRAMTHNVSPFSGRSNSLKLS